MKRLVAMDYPGRPVYILSSAKLPPQFRSSDWGYTMPGLDVVLRPSIKSWHGRGPCMTVDSQAIHFAAKNVRGFFVEDRLFFGVVLHEAAHWLDKIPAAFETVHDPDTVESVRVTFADHLAVKASLAAEPQQPATSAAPANPPFDKHGAPFIRASVHLAKRAADMGWGHRVNLAAIVQHDYGLSSLASYEAALGDEPQRLAGCSFAQIRVATPPPEFVAMWKADVKRWVNGLADVNEATAAESHRLLNVF
ncbi:MAG: hypothetical protein NTY19_08240 [Planctomycetota bacterium]|nr:hypothetical protein [Planctomycetota bacterium]